MKKFAILCLFFSFLSVKAFSQTLSPGDIVVVAYNADFDKFSFLALNDIPSGAVIKFTNVGWLNGALYYNGQGANLSSIIEYTLTSGISYGTVVTYTASSNTFSPSNGTINRYSWTGSTASSSVNLDWSGLGDQLLIYQGAEANPSFIFALNAQWRDISDSCLVGGSPSTLWQAGCYSSFSYGDSELPAGLINGVNAVTISPGDQASSLEFDNCKYSGTATGTGIFLLSEITDYTNWTGNNSTEETPASFTVTEPLPVELSSFSAEVVSNSIVLSWQTAAEVNNYGFEVQKLNNSQIEGLKDFQKDWETVGFVKGNGNSSSLKSYSFVDSDIKSGNYLYRLKQIDNNGTFEYSAVVEASFQMPEEFRLEQNYPNPFNPATEIRFSLPDAAETQLKIYDILGNTIAILLNERLSEGEHKITFNASGLPSGIYYYTLETAGFSSTKKMLVLK